MPAKKMPSTPEEILKFTGLVARGYTDGAIGKYYGVSRATASRWRNRIVPKTQEYTNSYDSQKDINDCLSCKRPRCVNCKSQTENRKGGVRIREFGK